MIRKFRQFAVVVAWIAFFSIPLLLFYTWDPFDASVTRVSHYKTTLQAIPQVLVRHFPTEAPKDNVWYFSEPGMLQANPQMQLLVKPSAQEIEKIYEEMSEVAIEHHVSPDSVYGLRVFDANGLDRPPPTKNNHRFVTYVGDGIDSAEAGVCINKIQGTVVYYCNLGKGNTFGSQTDAAK